MHLPLRLSSILAPLALSVLLVPSITAADAAAEVGQGARIFANDCGHCHAAPDPASRTRRQWNAISLHMRLFADLSRSDQQRLLAFLRASNTAAMSHKSGSPATR